MEQRTFFEHYRMCEEDGSPVEVSHTGSLITYKAVDTRFDEPVTIKCIPVASIDPPTRGQFERQARDARALDHVNIAKILGFGVEADHYIFVTEYLEGETLDSWVAAHGPLPPEAVLRVALQVVNAVAAAGLHGVVHRAIQPSNLVIVPGQTAEGGWPSIKVINFGLAALKLDSQGEAFSSVAPQFASPEEMQDGPSDFRSEIYALGATMCFLLTGVIDSASLRVKQLRRFPRPIRSLIAHMLRDNSDHRPQDPIAFAEEIHECMAAVERRQAFARRFNIPLVPTVPKRTDRPHVWLPPRALALAALLLMLATLAAILLPEDVVRTALGRNRDVKTIGVPVGVPEASPLAVAQNSSPVAASAPTSATIPASIKTASPFPNQLVTSPPAVANTTQNSPPDLLSSPAPIVGPSPKAAPVVSVQPNAVSSGQIAATTPGVEPPPPAEAPPNVSVASGGSVVPQQPATKEQNAVAKVAPGDASTQSQPNAQKTQRLSSITSSKASAKANAVTSATKRRSSTMTKRARIAQAPPDDVSPLPGGSVRARFLGMTADGRVILRLPSGRIVVAEPRDDAAAFRRRRVLIPRGEMVLPPPLLQPFDPGYPND